MKLIYTILFVTLTSASLMSQSEICLTNESSDSRYASYSPDGSKVLFESNRNGNWDIFIMDRDGSNPTALTSMETDQRRPSWHPDGLSIVYEEVASNQLIRLIVGSGEKNVLVDEKELNRRVFYGKMQFPRYNSKGTRISFTLVESEEKLNLVIFNVLENTLEELFYNEYHTACSSWSPKNESMVFQSRHETNNTIDNIYALNLRDESIRKLTSSPNHDFCPSYSPDGKQIAFVRSFDDKRQEIFVMERDGSNVVRITDNEEGETLPSWSPDGTHLLVTAFRNDNYQICRINLN